MSIILYDTTFTQLPFVLIEAKPDKQGVIYAPPDCTLEVFNPKGLVQLQGYMQCVARFQVWLENHAEPNYLAFEQECRRYCYGISKQKLYVKISDVEGSIGLAVAGAKIIAKLEVYMSQYRVDITLIDESQMLTATGLKAALNRLNIRWCQAKHPADKSEIDSVAPYILGKLRELRGKAAAA